MWSKHLMLLVNILEEDLNIRMDEIVKNEELQLEEIEALSAIFENDLVLEDVANREYSITLHNSSKQSVYFQFKFPATYPLNSPPTYLISAPWLNRDAKLYLSRALDDVYCQNLGSSIIFLWIETIKDFIEDTAKLFEIGNSATEFANTADAHDNTDEIIDYLSNFSWDNNNKLKDASASTSSQTLPNSIDIKHGEPIIDRKSIFQAHAAKVSSVEEVNQVLQILKENKKIASATHNIMAYRIHRGNVLIHDFDDDGESKAGSILLHLLEVLDASELVVVVSRWYGGIHLGSDRFKHIKNAARSLLANEGYIKSKPADVKKIKS